jgi:transposase
MSKIRSVGLDVHAATIAVAVAEPTAEVRSLGIVPNKLESIRRLAGKLGPAQHLKVCYEAGPTWLITEAGCPKAGVLVIQRLLRLRW